MPKGNSNKMPSQRQLRVGEQVRHVLSDIFFREEIHEPELRGVSITVSLVKVSPDLKNATAYVMPLAGENAEGIVRALNTSAPYLRKLMNKQMVLKYSPKLFFKIDKSFEEAHRINTLLKQEEIVGDLSSGDDYSDDSGENIDT